MPQLRDGDHAAAVRQVLGVRRGRRRALRRPARSGRGDQHQGRRDAPAPRDRAVRADEGRFKVYVIDEVHMLSSSAFNAMLKTLEEPPEHMKFILATTD